MTINFAFGQAQKANGYNYAGHTDFTAFWTDFKKAVASNDKQALIEMTKFTFTDFNQQAYGKSGLTCKTNVEFLNKLPQIFPNCSINLFENGKPEKLNAEMWSINEKNAGASYCLLGNGACGVDILGYVFAKDKNVYKLVGLKYME